MLCETYVPFGRAMASSSSDFDSSVHYSKHTFLSLLELGACEATIFGFVGSDSSVHCSKQRARAIWNHAKWDLIIKKTCYIFAVTDQKWTTVTTWELPPMYLIWSSAQLNLEKETWLINHQITYRLSIHLYNFIILLYMQAIPIKTLDINCYHSRNSMNIRITCTIKHNRKIVEHKPLKK